MEYIKLKEKEIIFDIESCGTSCGDDTRNDSVSGKKHAEELFKKLGSSVLGFQRSSEVEPGLKSNGVSGESIEESHESVRLLIENNPGGLQSQDLMPVVEKRREKEQLKFGKSKKAPKPPRPPKGPTLDAVDMKLVKEISMLATKKRERIERMKALTKMRAAKSLSSSSSPSSRSTLSAMIITVLFCLVIIFQGLGSRSSSPVTFPGAPEPSMMNKGLISVEFHNNGLSNDDSVPNSNSPNSAEQLSGLQFRSQE
ncbi:Uncharacterized protein Adt_01389 [Abeliophyllum distichum]|uniref:Transmembrane protein n=1 Tax=Abeliophyllum distichum TaxID=126358 RepID=A0ABD1VT32_9LAMI